MKNPDGYTGSLYRRGLAIWLALTLAIVCTVLFFLLCEIFVSFFE